MKDYLTVSEVAGLLGISSHTIRYYDKEGLLTSTTDEANQYRQFTMDDVVHLSNVILLRDMGLTIKSIRDLMSDFSTKRYHLLLNEVDQQLANQEKRIKQQREMIKNTLSLLENKSDDFKIETYDERFMELVSITDYYRLGSTRGVYEALRSIDIDHLIYRTLLYKLEEQKVTLCIDSEKPSGIKLMSGRYLVHYATIDDPREYDDIIEGFYTYASRHQIDVGDNLYMSILPDALLLADQGYRVQLFSRIIDAEG